ncbi:hypothetical protein Agub_g3580, partial [Astrephomene gubernaculifera]
MTKKRRTLRAEEEEEEEEAVADEDDVGVRMAPNTNFLGRLIRGVASGNQRQIDTTTSNAANMSIGATGAASLRLQLNRAANAKTARYQSLRRVVLSSAAQQRLTLCTALLAEVAQGFGFRLTVRRPDGQEVGARQAMAAVADMDTLSPRGPAAAAAAEGGAAGDGGAGGTPAAVPDGEDEVEDEEEDGGLVGARMGIPVVAAAAEGMDAPAGERLLDGHDGDAGGGGGGSSTGVAGAAGDPLGALEPLHVDLDLDLESQGVLLRVPQLQSPRQRATAAEPSTGLARRLASSPTALRPARPGGLGGLISSRLTSAALGSIGLVGAKKTAAAQALQAARRRALRRATSNAGAEGGDDQLAAAAATSTPAVDAVAAVLDDPAADTPVPGQAPPPGEAGAVPASGAGAGEGGGSKTTSAGTHRHIVWDPEKLSKTPPLAASTVAAAAEAPPPAKRRRASAPAGVAAGGGDALKDADAEEEGAAGGEVPASPEAEAMEEEEGAGGGADACASVGVADDLLEEEGYDGTATAVATAVMEGQEQQDGERGGGPGASGNAPEALEAEEGGVHDAAQQPGSDDRGTEEAPGAGASEPPRQRETDAEQPKRRDGASATAKPCAPARESRLLGSALAGTLAAAAGGSSGGRPRTAPIFVKTGSRAVTPQPAPEAGAARGEPSGSAGEEEE